MTKKIDAETHAAIKRSFHLSNEKIAALYGVKISTVARMRSYEPMTERLPQPSSEPYNPVDNTAETIAASARLRDAVRLCIDRMARRGRVPLVDWAAMDARMGRNL